MLKTSSVSDRLIPYLFPLIFLLTLAVFCPVLGHDFINYDDPAFIYANPYIQSGITWDAFRWAFTAGHEANWIPLSWLTHMLDVQLFGLNPAGHHAVNVLLHAGSSGLLFLFLKRASGSPWQSFAAALLFALHPLRVESVAWAAERKDVLSTFCWMVTLNAYARYAAQPSRGSYLLTLGCYFLGLLAKPMLVTLPLVLLVLDWWPLTRAGQLAVGQRQRQQMLRLIIEKIPFALLAAASSAITYLVQKQSGEVTQGYTLLSRLGKAGIAYLAYLGKMAWPVDLAPLYPFSKHHPSTLAIGGAALALVLLTLAAWRWRRQSPWLLAGWLWYLLTLLPVIGIIQVGHHAIADRYTYIPLTGVFVALVWSVPLLLPALPWRRSILGGGFAILLAVLIGLTGRQLRYWKNSETLFSHTIAVTQGNWVAHNNLGLEYYYTGRIDDAIAQYRLSLQGKPSYTVAYMNLGLAYRAQKDFSQSEEAFRWVLAFEPQNDTAWYNLALLYLEFGKREQALQMYAALQQVESPFAVELQRVLASDVPFPSAPR